MCASKLFPSRRSARGLWRQTPVWAAAALLLGSTMAVQAQSNSREQEMLRRLRQQVQQLQGQLAEQQALVARAQADQSALKTDAEATKTELSRSRAAAGQQTRRLSALQKSLADAQTANSQLQTRADQLQTELQQSQAELQDTRKRLDDSQNQGSNLSQRLNARDQAYTELTQRHALQAEGLQQCIDRNLALRQLGEEVLQRYAAMDFREVLAHREPFIQTRRVALENLVQDYADKLDRLALKGATPAAAANPAETGHAR